MIGEPISYNKYRLDGIPMMVFIKVGPNMDPPIMVSMVRDVGMMVAYDQY